MNHRAVVAATAGAGSGATAVAWAAREARLRGRPLRIVHVLEWSSGEAAESGGGSYVERVWSSSMAMTDAAIRRAREIAPELEITSDTLIGQPAARLLELASGAELVVLGRRGRGGFAGIRLGSVSLRVATHATCPVAVVRGRSRPGEPVAAGVDDSPAADDVLETAFAAAAGREARLTVVRALATGAAGAPETGDRESARLEELLSPWRRKFPQVRTEIRLSHGNSAAALIDASTAAQLIVVAGRSRGVVRGALLGPAGQQLLLHADCPVLVARPGR